MGKTAKIWYGEVRQYEARKNVGDRWVIRSENNTNVIQEDDRLEHDVASLFIVPVVIRVLNAMIKIFSIVCLVPDIIHYVAKKGIVRILVRR